jgi:integrase
VRADRHAIAFAIGCGLRQGEQWTLHIVDVHVDDDNPHVIVRYGGRKKGKLTPPKNGKTRRIELFGRALDAARAWLEILPTWCKTNTHGLMFPTQRGNYRRETKAPRGWSKPTRSGAKSYLEIAGLHDATARHDGRPVRWHDLRHTCGASLISGWWGRRWSLIEVRDQLGHKDIKTTQRYAHLAPDVLMAAARGTPGAASNMPAACPRPTARIVQVSGMIGRATLDSNQWPSAPEADALSS